MAVGQIRLDRADTGEIDAGPALPIQGDGVLIAHAVKDPVGRVVVHVTDGGAERVVARFEEDRAQFGGDPVATQIQKTNGDPQAAIDVQ